jgi:3-deoxy-D-manno-octulosonic-acid transferase
MSAPREISWGWWLAYNALVVPSAVMGYHLARFSSEKVREGLEGRQGLWRRLEAAKAELRGSVWFHATSVGEYEQARPILRALRAEAAAQGLRLPVLLTCFSPSGYNFARGQADFDHLDYLPLDSWPAAWRLVDLVRPRALVFVKFDCWPNMIWAARRRAVPVFLLDGTLHRRSHRLRPLARGFFGRLFDCFTEVGAISEEDAHRFAHDLGTRVAISVTGDTRTDQVVHRWKASEEGPLARHLRATGLRYLALGSIWPPDEACILEPALEAVTASERRGLVLVPHEPTPTYLERLEAAAARHGLVPTRLSELVEPRTHQKRSTAAARDPGRWRCIVVDTVGVLAEIYRATCMSYVGGSFSTGVHNVLEPAVCAQPVLFGPRIHNAWEAERLVERGCGFVVRTPPEARATLTRLLDDPEALARAGQAAQDFVLEQSGATEASLALLRPHLLAGEGP